MKRIITLLIGAFVSFSAIAQPCTPNAKSIKFDGSTSYIDLGTPANLAPDSAVTVEAWIKATTFSTNPWQNTVVSKDGWSQGEGGFSLRCGGNGILSFNIAGKTFAGASVSWKEALSSAAAITVNTWTHVAGVFDGATVKCFVNGVQVASTAFAGVIDKNALYQTRVGRLADNQGVSQYRNFNGYIDEVRIWERALSPTELLANMNSQINPAGQSRLRGYWRFNEGSGSTTGDLGTGNNAGNIFSALWDNAVPFGNAVVSSAISGPASVAPASSTSYAVSTHPGSSYLWSATNGTVTSGQNTSSVSILWGAAGPAGIRMIESNAFCSDTAQLSVWVGSVGINESSAKNLISLIPNPIKDKATFNFPAANNTVIRIMDMLGNEVLVLNAENKSSMSFNRAELKSGIYFYQIISDKKNRASGKLVVE